MREPDEAGQTLQHADPARRMRERALRESARMVDPWTGRIEARDREQRVRAPAEATAHGATGLVEVLEEVRRGGERVCSTALVAGDLGGDHPRETWMKLTAAAQDHASSTRSLLERW